MILGITIISIRFNILLLTYYFIFNLKAKSIISESIQHKFGNKNVDKFYRSNYENNTNELYLRGLYNIDNDLSNISKERITKDLENLNYLTKIINPFEFLHKELFITSIKNDSLTTDSDISVNNNVENNNTFDIDLSSAISNSSSVLINQLNKNNINSTKLNGDLNPKVKTNDDYIFITSTTTTTTNFDIKSIMNDSIEKESSHENISYWISSNSEIMEYNNSSNKSDYNYENLNKVKESSIFDNKINLDDDRGDNLLVIASYKYNDSPEIIEKQNKTEINDLIHLNFTDKLRGDLENNYDITSTSTVVTTITTIIYTQNTTVDPEIITSTTTKTINATITTSTDSIINGISENMNITKLNDNDKTKININLVPENIINSSGSTLLNSEINNENNNFDNLYKYYEDLINDENINNLDSFYTLDNPLKKIDRVINGTSNKVKGDKLVTKTPFLSTKSPNSEKTNGENPLDASTSTTTISTITENELKDNSLDQKTIIDDLHNTIKIPPASKNKGLNSKNVKTVEMITLSLLDSSYCKEKKNNFRRVSFLLKENIAKILSIHIHDVVIDDVYSESSNGFNIMSEKCTFSNGKLKGIIFDLSIIKNKLTDYPKYEDIIKITESETKFNKEYGKILVWKRNLNESHNKNNPFCQASLKESENIKFSCINHPINCIHNNEYKCYTNPMGLDCYCYNESFYDKNNLNHEEKAMKYGYKEGDNRVIIMENKIDENKINQLDDNLNDLDLTKECRAIILCTSDITTPVIQRCSSSPYSIGCPCSLNPYSKLCGCYINPFNPGCHCTYNKNSNDCKCLLRPEECRTANESEIDHEVVNRSPFDLRHGIRRFYRKHFRKSGYYKVFDKYTYFISIFTLYLFMLVQ
ncbi:hypothetical protein FG386_001568 [Cryptosporidium ryanae]|uniref:uncharacterized protein n=1 Tax=Cryptosporidium ryanae TaxID=515981 RepID=UPI00351A836D|nr:hypothetical protein FG386_001568 [Cryptosporidium ryanae]